MNPIRYESLFRVPFTSQVLTVDWPCKAISIYLALTIEVCLVSYLPPEMGESRGCGLAERPRRSTFHDLRPPAHQIIHCPTQATCSEVPLQPTAECTLSPYPEIARRRLFLALLIMFARRSVTTCLRSLPVHRTRYAAHSLAPRYSRTFSCTSAAMAALQRSAFFEAMRQHDPSSTAVVNNDSGVAFSYGSLLRDVSRAKERLLQETGKDEKSIAGERIAFMVENGYDYVGADSSFGNHPFSLSIQKLSHFSQSPCSLR
jgi:hypothetical protein